MKGGCAPGPGALKGRMLIEKTVISMKQALELASEKVEAVPEIYAVFEKMEKESPHTFDHSIHVARLAYFIGKDMGYGNKKLEEITLAGLLHDIGKMKVPLEILNSKNAYSKEEYIQMKKHPEYGYRMLRGAKFPNRICRSVLEHHENVDGTGYPDGRRGVRISEYGRILRIADVAEAMQSDRDYKIHYDLEKTCELMYKDRDSMYDPDILDRFLRLSQWKGQGDAV